ncbi:MAG TPA: tyrosine-type recombinase/integrase [Acidimicrobiales bacterium]|nr:tyrosine-type recombinase/integrase [Acidimicrobiales bacterium]
MSHINRRNGRWQAAYRGPDGRERTKTFDRKVDAERWLTAAQADLLRGTWVDPAEGRTTLEDYAARWLERMTPTWRAATAGAVRVSLEKHVLPVLGRYRLSALRRTDIEALCARLELAPSTVYVVYQHLYQLLSAAVEDGLIARNPASRSRLPKREPSKAQPVPFELVERIAVELPDWMKVVVPLGVGAGLRQGEICGLTADRIDFAHRRRRVDRQLISRYVPEPVLGPPRTESSNRTVPLATFVVEALWAHLERFPAEPGEPIVRMPNGLWVDSDRFGHPWRTACRRAGARGLRYHDLRHTFASILLSRGVSVKAVADWLGHASPKITLDTYAHLMPADEEVARGVLDAALDPFAEPLTGPQSADSRGLFGSPVYSVG